MSNNNIKTVGQSKRKLVADSGKPVAVAPEPVHELEFAAKIFLTKTISELMASGEYELDFPDELIAGKFANRVAKLEARIAELEKAAGKPVATDRANTAALAKK